MWLTHVRRRGEVLIALKIREPASTGMPFQAGVVREVEQYIYQLQTLFVLESLENLRKKGAADPGAGRWSQARCGSSCSWAPPPRGDLQAGTGAVGEAGPGKLVDRNRRRPDHRGDVRWPSATATMGAGLSGEATDPGEVPGGTGPDSGCRRHHHSLRQRRRDRCGLLKTRHDSVVGTERDPRCCSIHSASGRLIRLDGQGREGEMTSEPADQI